MTKQSTSKGRQYATEGEFGIGFKIWMKLFDKIELSFGKCKLKIDVEDNYPKFQTEWSDSELLDKFTITASNPKGKFLSDFVNNEDNLNELFERSVKGML